MTTNTDRPRASVTPGTCRVCRKVRPLSADDGRLLPHPTPISPDIECDGTGRLPLEASA